MHAGWRPDVVRLLWSAADITFLTIECKLFEKDGPATALGTPVANVETTLLVGYPLLIAASGLWWRMNLVWITTALAMCAYVWLYVDAAFGWRNGKISWTPSPDLQHPNIFLAALLVTGYVVARQVRRILLLSQYYEHRPPGLRARPCSAPGASDDHARHEQSCSPQIRFVAATSLASWRSRSSTPANLRVSRNRSRKSISTHLPYRSPSNPIRCASTLRTVSPKVGFAPMLHAAGHAGPDHRSTPRRHRLRGRAQGRRSRSD